MSEAEIEIFTDKGKLNKDAILPKVPMMLRGIVKGWIDDINNVDVNKDGQADISQLILLLAKVGPFLSALAPFVKVDALIDWISKQEFFDKKNQAEVKQCLTAVAKELMNAAEPQSK